MIAVAIIWGFIGLVSGYVLGWKFAGITWIDEAKRRSDRLVSEFEDAANDLEVYVERRKAVNGKPAAR